MSDDLPTLIRHDDPERQSRRDDRHGHFEFQDVVDGAAGPTSGLAHTIVKFDEGGHEAPHSHGVARTVHVLEGSGEVVIGDKTHALEKGDTVFVPAGVTHALRAPAGPLRVFCSFPADSLDAIGHNFDGEE
ncbi:cupin domain-containing protein [Mesobaculum littorinae]|nr:cupin domain-containing protein [Mesobaculum littorinae]